LAYRLLANCSRQPKFVPLVAVGQECVRLHR
jgi:hypothetical protein